jgi:hypothetical protein
MIGIEMKLNLPVHYQMGNPLQQGRWPCDLHIQSYLPLFWQYIEIWDIFLVKLKFLNNYQSY